MFNQLNDSPQSGIAPHDFYAKILYGKSPEKYGFVLGVTMGRVLVVTQFYGYSWNSMDTLGLSVQGIKKAYELLKPIRFLFIYSVYGAERKLYPFCFHNDLPIDYHATLIRNLRFAIRHANQ